MPLLSSRLMPIYELEISLGNRVARIDEPAGSVCPYAVVFASPLHLDDIRARIQLGGDVQFWEVRDPHHAAELGFVCEVTRHAVAGPIS